MSEENKELISKHNTTFLFSLDGDLLHVTSQIPEDTDLSKLALFLYKLNRGEFAETIIQSMHKYCVAMGKEAFYTSIIQEFHRLWKSNKVAVRPLNVLKDK